MHAPILVVLNDDALRSCGGRSGGRAGLRARLDLLVSGLCLASDNLLATRQKWVVKLRVFGLESGALLLQERERGARRRGASG